MNRLTAVFFLASFLILTCQPIWACTKPNLPVFDMDAYYERAAGLSGDDLKSALNTIIRGHIPYSYSCVWTILKEADQDPENPDNVIGIYSRRSIPKADQDRGGNTPDAWNREHIWAKSHGFRNKSQDAYTDAHHLRACDKSVNSDRGDKDFADGGWPHHECSGCNTGSDTWEAPDEVKGDVARMMFYMAARYEGNDSSGTPDLELVDHLTNSGSTLFGDLCDLVAWHIADPVSAEERARNEVIYSWQGNRNPFIDHPEYVLSIWGEACGIDPPAPVPVPAVSTAAFTAAAFLVAALGGAVLFRRTRISDQ